MHLRIFFLFFLMQEAWILLAFLYLITFYLSSVQIAQIAISINKLLIGDNAMQFQMPFRIYAENR